MNTVEIIGWVTGTLGYCLLWQMDWKVAIGVCLVATSICAFNHV